MQLKRITSIILPHFRTHVTTAISLLAMSAITSAAVDNLFNDCTQKCDGGLEDARKLAASFAAGTGEDLGYHSNSGTELREFSGDYTPPELPEGEQGSYMYGLAVFSDDGCDVVIDGETVHSRYKIGQALPRMKQSFHPLPILLQPGKEVHVEVKYSNTRFLINDIRPDIDGCTLFLYKVRAGITVDADRNGEIDFVYDRTHAGAPFRFWVNNDQDDEEDDEKSAPAEHPDSQDAVIKTTRDLEDFARLQVTVGQLQDKLKSGEIDAVIKFRDGTTKGNPALNIWPQMNGESGRVYLTHEIVAQVQIDAPLIGTIRKDQGVTLPRSVWDGSIAGGYSAISEESPIQYFLFEGVSEGSGELVIEFMNKGKTMGEAGSCWISLMNVRKMYERVKLTPDDPDEILDPVDFGGEKDNPAVLPPETKMVWKKDPNKMNFISDPDEDKHYIVFVHGWRMTYERSNKYGETMYKRLWQAGYKGRFVSVRWPTFSQETNPKTRAILTYNKSDYRAWQSGKPLATFINSLPPDYIRCLVAHSMGNVVASSALREGAVVEHYALLNAAIPAMCYDGNKQLYKFDYNTPDEDDDPITQNLGFSQKIKESDKINMINFCLVNDAALKIWEFNNKKFKPDYHNTPDGVYHYDKEASNGERLHVTFAWQPTRHVRLFHEAAAYATKSLTKAVGAEPKTRGSIDKTVNLDDRYGFDENHSAQWQLNIQKNYRFYSDMLVEFGE